MGQFFSRGYRDKPARHEREALVRPGLSGKYEFPSMETNGGFTPPRLKEETKDEPFPMPS